MERLALLAARPMPTTRPIASVSFNTAAKTTLDEISLVGDAPSLLGLPTAPLPLSWVAGTSRKHPGEIGTAVRYAECGTQTAWDHVVDNARIVERGMQTASWNHLVEQSIEEAVLKIVARMETCFEKRIEDLLAIIETLKRGRDDLRVAVRAADALLQGATGTAADLAAREFFSYSWDALLAAGVPWQEATSDDIARNGDTTEIGTSIGQAAIVVASARSARRRRHAGIG